MKNKRLLTLFVSTCLILVLAVLPFMAACAAPVEPGVVDVAKLQKEIASLDKEVASLKGKITTAEAKASTSEKEAAASKKEIAAAEKEITTAEKDKAAAEKEIASLEGKVSTAEKEIAKLEAAAPEPVEVLEWKSQNYFVGGAPMYIATGPDFDERVAEMSDGRLVITSYPEAALVPSAEIASAVGAGTVEMGMTCGGYHMGLIPIGALEGALPMWLAAAELDYFFHDYGGIEIVRRAYAEHNIYWIVAYDDTAALLMSTKPVRTVADLEGMKIRSYGASSRMWDGLGASTKWVPGAEIYIGLATGVFDGAHYGGPAMMWELLFQEVTSYILMDPAAYYAGNGHNEVNLDAWNALPDDLQAIIFYASQEVANEHRRYNVAMGSMYLARMVAEYGIEKTWFSAEDMAVAQEAAMEVWKYYSTADKYTEEYYELMMAFARDVGKIE